MVTDTTGSPEAPQALMFTLYDLANRTADVIAEVNAKDTPALITRHGRIIARIDPLANKDVEGQALSLLHTDEND